MRKIPIAPGGNSATEVWCGMQDPTDGNSRREGSLTVKGRDRGERSKDGSSVLKLMGGQE